VVIVTETEAAPTPAPRPSSAPPSSAPPPTHPPTPTPTPSATLTPITTISWTGAHHYACSTKGSDFSSSSTASKFSVIDATSYGIDLYWLNATGAPVLEFTVAAGGSYIENTYVGDYWMVTNTADSCEGIVQLIDSASSVVIS
jgi:hypothetical protein